MKQLVTIITKHDDNSTLDFLATECEYEVTLFTMDDTTTSAMCEGKDAGLMARDYIDNEKLLQNDEEPFPSIYGYITKYMMPFVNQVGL